RAVPERKRTVTAKLDVRGHGSRFSVFSVRFSGAGGGCRGLLRALPRPDSGHTFGPNQKRFTRANRHARPHFRSRTRDDEQGPTAPHAPPADPPGQREGGGEAG